MGDSKLLWEIIEIFAIMLVIATIAYAPLGYFIHKYIWGDSKPFGNTQPHGDQSSLVNDLAETGLHFAKEVLSKK